MGQTVGKGVESVRYSVVFLPDTLVPQGSQGQGGCALLPRTLRILPSLSS